MITRVKVLLFIAAGAFTTLQAQIREEFSDGNLLLDPVWIGDTSQWVEEKGLLRSRGPQSSASSISLFTVSPYTSACQWEFLVNPKLATSSQNFADIILIADQVSHDSFRGYFVRTGGTPDEVSLYRRDGTTAVKIIDGADGFISSTSNNPTRIKVLRSAGGEFTLLADNTGAWAYQVQGKAQDASYLSPGYFGFAITYSSSNYNRYYFDDFYIGPPLIDTISPHLAELSVIRPDSLLLIFSEALSSSAINPQYYVVAGMGNPVMVWKDVSDARRITIKTSSPLQSPGTYVLELSGLSDVNGNIIQPASWQFTHYIVQEGDVLISEIMADPSPVAGLPEREYIELYNRSPYSIQLKGWQLGDASGLAVLPSFLLSPDSFVIICANTAYTELSSLGTTLSCGISATLLNNAGDEIMLTDPSGKEIDRILYSDSWYRDNLKKMGGYALERINPFYPCKSQESNWIASCDLRGGTPGKLNCAHDTSADSSKAIVRALAVLSSDSLLIVFNKEMNGSTLMLSSFRINDQPIKKLNLLSLSGDTVILFSKAPLAVDARKPYKLGLVGIRDCSGNMVDSVYSFYYAPAQIPKAYDLIFTEVMADPEPSLGLPPYEYIEVFNRSDNFITLDGSKLSYGGKQQSLPPVTVPPGAFLIICDYAAETQFLSFGNTAGMHFFPSLAQSGAVLTLINSLDEPINRVEYSDQWYDNGFQRNGGVSLELGDTAHVCASAGAWKPSIAAQGGTPGKISSRLITYSDTEPPQMLHAYPVSANKVLLYFNKGLSESSCDPSFFRTLPGGFTPAKARFTDYSHRIIELEYAISLSPGIIYTITAEGIKDCSGNRIEETTVRCALPDAMQTGLVINELLFNPRSGGSDFVEIFNTGDKTLDLKGMKLANADESGAIKDMSDISSGGMLIFPGDYFVFAGSSASIGKTYHVKRIHHLFDIPSLPSWPDEEGTVVLLDSTGKEWDRLSYSREWHFGLLANEDGVSLERIDPRANTGNPSNWTSASTTCGYATPTSVNSQYLLITMGDDAVNIDPVTFSPDGDGFEDLMILTFHFPKAGNMANIKVFDESGREVQTLAANENLSAEGYYRWDGINSKGEKAPAGVYMVWFQIFDLEGRTKVFRKPFVLAGRF